MTTLEPLQHDPRTKQQIKDVLYNALYTPVQDQFNKRLENLVIKNTMLLGADHKSLVYKGVVYSCDSTKPPIKMNRLHASLKKDMDSYLSDVKELNDYELPFVLGYITQVLNSTNDLCDYLKLLPENLHRPIRHLIDTCPCRAEKLPLDKAEEIKEKNKKAIGLMKERMVRNLLI